MEAKEAEAMVKGQVAIWRYLFGFADSMVLKCAVELRIADIINSYGQPITLQKIASSISRSSSLDIPSLARIMRLLVRRDIFASYQPSEGGETLYGLTYASRWLVTGFESNLASMVMMQSHPLLLATWDCIGQCIREGEMPFKKAHGVEMWEMASKNPSFNKLFNDAMECNTKTVMQAILGAYKDGFEFVGTIVDMGGGTGGMIAEIVKANPDVRGINFDLPHVVATAPAYPGVEHVGGSMFESVPAGDAIVLKYVLHTWGDEDCVKILKNCRKAIPETLGKLIIVELVLQPEGNGPFDDIAAIFDVMMFAHQPGGKERTELEWKNLLAEGGFPRYNIIKIPSLPSIIEAYPN
ncbi:(R,S)-reticuline 7-O-methyltransferase-like [Punica granatum]|uniref:(R,S)-reticuline 7-O-methyltransferase-like n=1 Tax=Punica granatum TaxID=22663 RepID=A0A6P8BZD6_PUNGR|nr:(R,S)-reticuline 7-O-methyltransferase-like [Punica granatum]